MIIHNQLHTAYTRQHYMKTAPNGEANNMFNT